MDTCKSDVKDAPRRANGDPAYQAEVLLSYGATGEGGRERMMAIRGPCRSDRNQAEEDAQQLEDAAKNGVRAVRELANKLKRTTIARGA